MLEVAGSCKSCIRVDQKRREEDMQYFFAAIIHTVNTTYTPTVQHAIVKRYAVHGTCTVTLHASLMLYFLYEIKRLKKNLRKTS